MFSTRASPVNGTPIVIDYMVIQATAPALLHVLTKALLTDRSESAKITNAIYIENRES